jgi:SAM-dependent methyltransferase
MMTSMYTWRDIPGWFDFQDIYEQAVAEAKQFGSHFVEVGVLFGKSAAFMAEKIRESGKQIQFSAVDSFAWTGDGVVRETDRAAGCLESRELLDELKALPPSLVVRTFAALVAAESLPNVNLVPVSGVMFAQCCKMERSLDFVFIDASHTYDDTLALLLSFLPLVKPGGVLAGHDHGPDCPGVIKSVAEVLGKVEQRGSSFWWRKH